MDPIGCGTSYLAVSVGTGGRGSKTFGSGHCSSATIASTPSCVCFALIHVPLDEQPDLLRNIRRWLRPGGLLLATVGHTAWTGVEKDWLGVDGADMWWSHADAETYRLWFGDAGLQLQLEKSITEGNGGRHTLVLASRRVP